MPITPGGEKPVPPFLPSQLSQDQQAPGSVLRRVLDAQKNIPTTPGGTPPETKPDVSTPPFVKEEELTEADKKAMQEINGQSTYVQPNESGRKALERLANKLKTME